MIPAPGPVDRLRRVVAEKLGLVYDQDKHPWLEETLRRRVQDSGLSYDAYLGALENHDPGRELQSLIPELTVGETYFFRHKEQLQAFSEVVLPDRAQTAQGRPVQILSAGCSTGEEPYSLAILAHQAEVEVAILGVDVNSASLRKAEKARYSQWSLRETPDLLRDTWFQPDGVHSVLRREVTKSVSFRPANLAENDPSLWRPQSYDVIFCRNVLMYFEPARARQLLARIAESLAEGGYLFLGHAESLRGLSDDFELVNSHKCFYYRRSGAPAAAPIPPPPYPALETGWVEAIRAASERIRGLTTPEAVTPQEIRHDLRAVHELHDRERFGEALEALQKLPAAIQASPEGLQLQAVLLVHLNRFVEGEVLCRELIQVLPAAAGPHYLLALCRAGAGDSLSAAHEHRAAARLEPDFAMPRLHLGLLARRARDLATARRELEQALLLLQREESPRLRLYGGGFGREALMALCRSELGACRRQT